MRVLSERSESKDLSFTLPQLTLVFSSTFALSVCNGDSQPLSHQLLPHSFPCNGGGRGQLSSLLAIRRSPLHCPLTFALPILPIAISFIFIQIRTAQFANPLF